MASKKVAKLPDRDDYIREQVAKYQARNLVLEEIVAAGNPIKTTSIGRTQWDPRTCTCGVKSRTDKDHSDDCAVEPVTDSGPVLSAIKELRLNNSYLDALIRQAQGPDESEAVAEAFAYTRELGERCKLLESENSDLRAELDRWQSGDLVLSSPVPYIGQRTRSGHMDLTGIGEPVT